MALQLGAPASSIPAVLQLNEHMDFAHRLPENPSEGFSVPVMIRVLSNDYAQELDVVFKSLAAMSSQQSSLKSDTLQNVCLWSIVTIFAKGSSRLALATPLHENGNIMEYIVKKVKEGIQVDKREMVVQLASAITSIHDDQIVHGNIHPGNILIDNHGHIRLSDIGVYVALRNICQASGNIPIPSSWMYMPVDELTDKRPISNKTDVFGFASTVYEIFTSRPPAPRRPGPVSVRDVSLWINSPDHKRPQEIPDAMWRVLALCWAENPDQRPGMREVEAELRML